MLKRKHPFKIKTWCPWCGKRAFWDAGYIECDRCEVVTKVKAVT